MYEIDPWGEERADLRMGILASTMQSTVAKPQPPTDFMPYRKRTTGDDVNQKHLKAKWFGITERWERKHGR